MTTTAARPLVIAHRGASWDEPENTLAAFRRAIEVGADYVELDVQATRDGELVVLHDPAVSGRRLRELSLADLRALRPEVPTFAEVLEECAGRIGLAVELKQPYRYRRHRLTGRTLAALEAHGADPDSVIVVSFEPGAIRETRRLRPGLRTIQHVEYVPVRVAATYAWGVGFWDARATPRRIAAAQKLGLATTVYTVNEEARMRELAALGVAGIFSDRPDLLRRGLA